MHTPDWLTTRRNVLRSALAVPVLGVGVSEARALADRHDGTTLSGALDANFDGQRDLHIRRAPDPSDETPKRGQVLHATSDGAATTDYAVSLAVTDDERLVLDDLVGDGAGFTYDYFAGEGETGHVPDEAWLVLRSRQTDRDGVHSVLRTEDDGAAFDGWQTRDVGAEIRGEIPEDGSGQQWKEFDRDGLTVQRIGYDLRERFGGDARVLAAGVGRGTPSTGPTVADVYFDAFVLGGEERRLDPTGPPGEGRGRN